MYEQLPPLTIHFFAFRPANRASRRYRRRRTFFFLRYLARFFGCAAIHSRHALLIWSRCAARYLRRFFNNSSRCSRR